MSEGQSANRRTDAPLNYPHVMQTDHDAIVTLVSETRQLRTEIREMKGDIKEVKNNVASRVNDLEREKLDKEEAARILAEANKLHEDHEKRLRRLEWALGLVAGALFLLQFFKDSIIHFLTR